MRYNIRITDMCTLWSQPRRALLRSARSRPQDRLAGDPRASCTRFRPSTGEELWNRPCASWGWGHPADVFVIDGLVWVHDYQGGPRQPKQGRPGSAADLATGNFLGRFARAHSCGARPGHRRGAAGDLQLRGLQQRPPSPLLPEQGDVAIHDDQLSAGWSSSPASGETDSETPLGPRHLPSGGHALQRAGLRDPASLRLLYQLEAQRLPGPGPGGGRGKGRRGERGDRETRRQGEGDIR